MVVGEAVIGIFVGLVSLLVLIYLFLIWPTKWVKLELLHHDLGLGMKVIQISDLHVERLRVTAKKIKRILEKEKPNYIFLTGDFLDTREGFAKLKNYLEVIEQTQIPTYAVLGNHDYYLEDVDELMALLKSYGVRLLINENVKLEDFVLVGIDDYGTRLSDPSKAFKGVRGERPVIVLTHDPNLVLVMEETYDYLMSGHLHGKQLNIPFLFKVMPMGELPRSGIYKGVHKNKYGTYYISKGLGQTGWNIRFMVRSEMTIHLF